MVSVIVPVYRSERTLLRCVKSLREQTGIEEGEIEIILVDDGSPDECPQICDRLAGEDSRIRVIHKENGGVSSARNAGIEAAEGEYLFFVDSDDYVEPSALHVLISGIRDADIAICGFHHHYKGRDVCKIPAVPGNSGDENFLALYGQGFMNMPWNKLFRRELAGRYDESLSLGEDLLFNLDYLLRADGVAVVEEALYHYIQDDTGQTLSSARRDDKLELAKMIWREVSGFYCKLSGHEDESGIINARLIQEVLDDVESLPFDTERSRREKQAVIKEYMKDPVLKAAGKPVALQALDYKILHGCMRLGLVRVVYGLSVLRAALVRSLRRQS
jgi:glycosyltransferase involved in cell wall biosynthesis